MLPPRSSLRQLVVFGAVGLTATLGYAVGTWLLGSVAGWPPVAASVTSYAVCALFSFLLHSMVTFKVGRGTRRDLGRFVVTTVIGFSLAAGVMKIIEILEQPLLLGVVIVSVAIPLTNFLALKYWVFHRG